MYFALREVFFLLFPPDRAVSELVGDNLFTRGFPDPLILI